MSRARITPTDLFHAAAQDDNGVFLVHRVHQPGDQLPHLPGQDGYNCYCCPLILTSEQVHAYRPAELQGVLDQHYSVQ